MVTSNILRDRLIELIKGIMLGDSPGDSFIDIIEREPIFFIRIQDAGIKGRKWYISPYMTDGEILQTIFKAILTYDEHEIREKFLFKGKRIFGPHHSLEDLMRIKDEYRND